MTHPFLVTSVCGALAFFGCKESHPAETPSAKEAHILDMKRATDHHSFAKPAEAVTTHLSWDAEVDFDTRQIHATATYNLTVADDAEQVLLDHRGMDIHSVQDEGPDVALEMVATQPSIGQPLSNPMHQTPNNAAVAHRT